MLDEVSFVMPTTVADLSWFLASGMTMVLISIVGVLVWWGFTKLSDKVDELISTVAAGQVEMAVIKTSLLDHVENEGVHCKNGECNTNFKAQSI